MQRLQIIRMRKLFKLGLVLLTAACGDAGGATGDATQPSAAGDAPAIGTANTANPAQSTGSGSAAGSKALAPSTTATAAAGAASPSSMNASAASSSSSSSKAPSTATTTTPAASAGAAAPATASSSSTAGAPAQPAAGSGAKSGATETAAGASGGAAGAAAPTGVLTEDGIDPLNPDWSKRTDLGKGDGSDVVTIGDSWMDYIGGGGGIQAGLDRAGFNYRHYALSGTTLLSGQIPSQYTQAKAVNAAIKTIIMTGGGNDVMFSGGCNTAELCEMSVMQIQQGLQDLWSQMADDGVKDVIYIQYSEDAGTAPAGTRPKSTKPVPICLTGRILCHSVPTTEIVMGQLVDGIHPTLQANDRIAAELVKIMEARKIRR